MDDLETLNEFYKGGGRLEVPYGSELYKKVNDMSESVNPLVIITNFGRPLETESIIYGFELNNSGKERLMIEKVRNNRICQAVNGIERLFGIAPITNLAYDIYASRLVLNVDESKIPKGYDEFGKRI